ncbi:MAG: GspH/FimT family pseudopilin [Phycisphaerales bacterium]|nr:GspH/FimT family pseudopilin [Phycisphaerales bacterium]
MSRRSILSRGFSLVELIAVMVVLAVLSAVAASRIAVIPSSRGSMAAQLLMRDLAFARDMAVSTGRVHWIEFDLGGQRYTMLAEPTVGGGWVSRLAVVDPGTGRSFQRNLNRDELAGVTITSSTLPAGNAVGFNRLGRPVTNLGASVTSDSTIQLTGNRVVNVIVSTGAITRSGNP